MSWDYKQIDGKFWNGLSLDMQLGYLREYYPIGEIFHKTNHIKHESVSDCGECSCIIERYVLVGNNNATGWYILGIKNINNPYTNVEYEQIHPGFFRPGIRYNRNKKLEELLGEKTKI